MAEFIGLISADQLEKLASDEDVQSVYVFNPATGAVDMLYVRGTGAPTPPCDETRGVVLVRHSRNGRTEISTLGGYSK